MRCLLNFFAVLRCSRHPHVPLSNLFRNHNKKTNLTENVHYTISSHLLRRFQINCLPCSFIRSTWTQLSKKRSDAFSCWMVVVSPLLVSSDRQFYYYCLPLHLQILVSGPLFCVNSHASQDCSRLSSSRILWLFLVQSTFQSVATKFLRLFCPLPP